MEFTSGMNSKGDAAAHAAATPRGSNSKESNGLRISSSLHGVNQAVIKP